MDAVRAFSSLDAVHAFVDAPPPPHPSFLFFFLPMSFLLLMCVVCVACVCVVLRWRGGHSSPPLFFCSSFSFPPFFSSISALECRRVTVIFFLPHRPGPHDRACTRLVPRGTGGEGGRDGGSARADVPNRRSPRPIVGPPHLEAGGAPGTPRAYPRTSTVSKGTDRLALTSQSARAPVGRARRALPTGFGLPGKRTTGREKA